MFYLYVNKYVVYSFKQPYVEFFSLQTASVVYFQKKVQLSGFSAYPDGFAYQLIRFNGVLPYIRYNSCY